MTHIARYRADSPVQHIAGEMGRFFESDVQSIANAGAGPPGRSQRLLSEFRTTPEGERRVRVPASNCDGKPMHKTFP